MVEIISKERGKGTFMVRYLMFIVSIAKIMGHMKQRLEESHGRRSKTRKIENKSKVKH